MTNFPATKKSGSGGGKPLGLLNARLTKLQLVASTSTRMPDGSYEKDPGTLITPPRKVRVLLGAAKFGPYRIVKGEKADYSRMLPFPEASENGWETAEESDREGIRVEVEIEGFGRTIWTSSQVSIRNMIWRMCENWHSTAPEGRNDRFVFTKWRIRTNPIDGSSYGELVLEPDTGQAESPPPSRFPGAPKGSGPRWDTPEDDDDLDDSIPF
jgi:hypothetical protein